MSREFIFEKPGWYEKANCRGKPMRLWFPDNKTPISKEAKEICDTCEVKQECLEYGIENEFYGVWGGMSSKKRGRIRSERGISIHYKRIAKASYDD